MVFSVEDCPLHHALVRRIEHRILPRLHGNANAILCDVRAQAMKCLHKSSAPREIVCWASAKGHEEVGLDPEHPDPGLMLYWISLSKAPKFSAVISRIFSLRKCPKLATSHPSFGYGQCQACVSNVYRQIASPFHYECCQRKTRIDAFLIRISSASVCCVPIDYSRPSVMFIA